MHLKQALAMIEPVFQIDRSREVQYQTLSSLRALARKTDAGKVKQLDLPSRDAAVVFLGVCAGNAKRRSDAHRVRKVLGIFLRRHEGPHDKENFWGSGFSVGSSTSQQVVADVIAAEEGGGTIAKFEYDTDDEDFSFA